MDTGQSYFELFGLEAGFNIDLSLLSERYRELQKLYHPDRFAGAGESEQLQAVQATAHLNDALSTLKSPLKRALYLLRLRGVVMDHETSRVMDPGFLMQQMELREEVEEARHSSDPEAALEAVEAHVESGWKALVEEFVSLYEQGDEAGLAQAADRVRRLQFLEKLRHEIEQLEDELTDY